MALKVALMGLSQATRHLAPWNDPDWELWGLAWDADAFRMHRTFELHDMADLERTYPNLPAYLDRIQHCSRLYMTDKFLPNAAAYPFDAVGLDVGDYWCSSIAYMLALAIHERAEEIGIYGVAMAADDEYGYQKPNCEYLIGLARGRGIKVHVPEQSPLCKFVSPPDRQYRGRYGRT